VSRREQVVFYLDPICGQHFLHGIHDHRLPKAKADDGMTGKV
jgi:hypothetical protein